MTAQENWPADPLIDEVRARRQELFARCGYNLRELFRLIQQRQAEHPEKVGSPLRTRPQTSHAETAREEAEGPATPGDQPGCGAMGGL